MWHTSEGDRELAGAEAALVKAAITSVVEQIKEAGVKNADVLRPLVQSLITVQDRERLLLDPLASHSVGTKRVGSCFHALLLSARTYSVPVKKKEGTIP